MFSSEEPSGMQQTYVKGVYVSGTHPASYPIGTKGSSLGVKRPGREANHPHPSSTEVKNAWSYTSSPPVRLHSMVLSQK
jgi:hypothetical protein